MIIVFVTIISFILEYLFNGFFHSSFLVGLIIFSSLILLEPYFKKNKNMYFLYCFIVGFLYDYVYTGVYFMNAGLFLVIGVVVDYINSVSPNNLFVSILELLFLIVLYRFISFVFLGINGVVDFSFDILFRSIYCSLLLNVIYGVFLYFILYLLSLKFNIKRIN